MNKALPSREQAIQLLINTKCRPQVISHCQEVADYAHTIVSRLQAKGCNIDMRLVEAGALLHDLGRSQTQTIDHAVVGGQIAQSLGLPEAVVSIIKRHLGAGITEQEAAALGWPKDVYVPQTLEEKIVCYADKRVFQGKIVPIENEIERLAKDGKASAAERVRSLHSEITTLLGENP